MFNLSKSNILLWAGGLFFLLYALVAWIVNTISHLDEDFFYLGAVLFTLYLGYFFVFQFFKDKPTINLSIKGIAIFSSLFSLLLVLAVPHPGSDFYHYFFEDVAVVKYHYNPYFITPNDLPQEPASVVSGWPFLPSQHGPLKFFLTLPVGYLSQNNIVAGIFLYKLTFASFLLGSVLLVYKILKTLNLPWAEFGTLLFAWNPLVIYDTQLFGGTDILMMFWLLAAIYAALKNKFYFSVVLLAFSVLVKYVTLLFLPFFLLYYIVGKQTVADKVWSGFKYLAIFGVTVLVFFYPFWRGLDTLAGAAWVGNYFAGNSLAGMLYLIAAWFNINVSNQVIKAVFGIIFSISYLIVLGKFLSRTITPERWLVALTMVMGAYLLIGKFWFYDKYLIWLIPLIFLLNKKFFAIGVFLTGMLILGPFDLDLIVLLIIPPAIVFTFYYYIVSPKTT